MYNNSVVSMPQHNNFDGSVSIKSSNSGTFTMGQLKESRVDTNFKSSKKSLNLEGHERSKESLVINNELKTENSNKYLSKFKQNLDSLNKNDMNKDNKDDKNIEILNVNNNADIEMNYFVKEFTQKLEYLESKLDKQEKLNDQLKNYNETLENKLINSNNET
jgi:hypothetical protein